MSCEVKDLMGSVCRSAQIDEPVFCQARDQASADLQHSASDPLLGAQVNSLEADIARTFAGCPQLAEVITGIRQELARRRAEQNTNPLS